jgi:hypothetical protein
MISTENEQLGAGGHQPSNFGGRALGIPLTLTSAEAKY